MNFIKVDKGKWIEMLAKNISDVKLNPKLVWDNIKTLKDGFSGHHVEKSIKFRNNEGFITYSDNNNAEISGKYFSGVLI